MALKLRSSKSSVQLAVAGYRGPKQQQQRPNGICVPRGRCCFGTRGPQRPIGLCSRWTKLYCKSSNFNFWKDLIVCRLVGSSWFVSLFSCWLVSSLGTSYGSTNRVACAIYLFFPLVALEQLMIHRSLILVSSSWLFGCQISEPTIGITNSCLIRLLATSLLL